MVKKQKKSNLTFIKKTKSYTIFYYNNRGNKYVNIKILNFQHLPIQCIIGPPKHSLLRLNRSILS